MSRVRRAAPADASAIARVYVDTWRSVYAGLVPDRVLINMSHARQSLSWARQLDARRGGHGALVAEVGRRRIAGVASFGPARNPKLGFAGEIYTLYVADDYWGQGLGRALLGGAFRELERTRRKSAYLWVLADNPTRFFYDAMGGRRVAERLEPLWGTTLREVAYGWPDLGEALIRVLPGSDRSRPERPTA